MPEHDAVVVGSGPNGLAAAIELARNDLDVLLIEGRDTIGGGMRTAELTLPGFRHDICSAVLPTTAASPYFSRLPLAGHGLDWIQPTLPVGQPLPDGDGAVQFPDIDETAEHLGSEDGRAYRKLMKPFVRSVEALIDGVLNPVIGIPRSPLVMARFGAVGVRSAEALASRFEGDRARANVAGAAAHAITSLDAAFTAALPIVFSSLAHTTGWPIARGGTQSLADALAGYFESLGGRIETGHMVTSLDELPSTRAILLDVSPRGIAGILGDRIQGGFADRLREWNHGPGVFKVDWALDGPVPWTNELISGAGTVHVGGTFEDVAASEAEVMAGRHPERPFILLSQPTLWDESRAPEGKHVVWGYCHVPNGSTVDMTDRIEAHIEEYAPGFRDLVIGRHTMDTAAYEVHNPNYVGGDIGGGAFTPMNVISRSASRGNPYATPLDNVFMCSSSTPPGAGVHGMAGYNAASLALDRIFN